MRERERVLPRREEPELVVDTRHAARCGRAQRHLGGLETVHGGGLLAVHMRAGFDRCEHHRMMQEHGRDDADEVGLLAREQLAPVAVALTHAHLGSDALGLRGIRSRERDHFEAGVTLEAGHLDHAAERRAEDRDAVLLHGEDSFAGGGWRARPTLRVC